MNRKLLIIAAAAAVLALGAVAWNTVQTGGLDRMPATTGAPASTKAYETAMAAMMRGMMVPLTGKPDLDFMQGMIPHHQGAIDMAGVVLRHGKDTAVRTLAQNVITAQEGEIAVMKAWLAATDPATLAVSPPSVKGNEQAMAVMMKDMMTPWTGDADVDFVRGMIPHHQGAIAMADVALQFAGDKDVRKLAGDVVKAQQAEVAFMTDWLAKHGK